MIHPHNACSFSGGHDRISAIELLVPDSQRAAFLNDLEVFEEIHPQQDLAAGNICQDRRV